MPGGSGDNCMSAFRDGLFQGQSVFVAGGTSGINLGMARRFAQLGARVAVLGRNADKASAAARSIGPEALGLAVDVRDYAALRQAMEQVADRQGAMDVVISGAAGNFLAPALGMSANAFRTVVDIDLNGTFNVFRGCYDLLRRPGASLIAITAGQAEVATPLQAHACAAKAGINQLVRVLALEWGPDVRVNAISPGPVADTEGMSRLAHDGPEREAYLASIPLKRMAQAEEVAEAAVFLASSSAAYITGAILDCDGGAQLAPAPHFSNPANG